VPKIAILNPPEVCVCGARRLGIMGGAVFFTCGPELTQLDNGQFYEERSRLCRTVAPVRPVAEAPRA
jgi:hypothetical protein